jgi:hypothetical protein
MNEEPTMPQSDEHRGGNGLTAAGNGLTDSIEEADTLKLEPLEWPPPRRRFDKVRQVMSGRVRPSTRQDVEPLTRVPGWLATLACSALLVAVTQTGYLIYRISHYDTVEKQVQERIGDIYEDLRAQDQYNQLVTIYENKIQQMLIQMGVDRNELPQVPVRPTLGKPHPKRNGDKGD